MTALDLDKRLKDGSSTCEGAGCIRKGRRKMYIAGYPVPPETKYSGNVLMLCDQCAAAAKEIYKGALS
jgi:hypothetical protein